MGAWDVSVRQAGAHRAGACCLPGLTVLGQERSSTKQNMPFFSEDTCMSGFLYLCIVCSVCVFVSVCMCICMYVYVCLCAYVCVCMCVCTCVHVYTFISMHMHTGLCAQGASFVLVEELQLHFHVVT